MCASRLEVLEVLLKPLELGDRGSLPGAAPSTSWVRETRRLPEGGRVVVPRYFGGGSAEGSWRRGFREPMTAREGGPLVD